MNLLTKLKNGRAFRKSRASLVIVFISILVGAFLFRFYGAAAYSCFYGDLSNARFCIIYTVIFALLMFSAFSQLGTLTVIVADTVFEFFILMFSTGKTSEFALEALVLLTVQELLIISFTMFVSEKALILSNELVRRTANDRRYFASVAASFIAFLSVMAILVIICITAF